MKKRNLELLGLVENEKLKSLRNQEFKVLNEERDCAHEEQDVDVQEFEQKRFESRQEDEELYNLNP